MNKEELLKTLHDSGLADDEIKALLRELMHDLETAEDDAENKPEDARDEAKEDEMEKEEASRLLGVDL